MPTGDGTWRITGRRSSSPTAATTTWPTTSSTWCWRVPGAPRRQGISCFIVPKFLVSEDGTPGERNSLECVSVEAKMGINASPTCVMAYDSAIGYLIGEANEGMRYMFKMMNNARLSVGVEGLSLGERAYQQAVEEYARERRRGACARAPAGRASPIVDHPDVRRMLTMQAHIEALRCLAYLNAESLDLASRHPDDQSAPGARELADLLTPILAGAPTSASSSPRWPGPRRDGLHRGDRRGPALPRRPHPRPSAKAPTASRPWTWSAASCRCA